MCGTIRANINMNLFDLSGEVAVVIGATGVLGGALAQGLAEAGAKVAVLGRNEERGQARVKSIQEKSGHAAFFSADAVSRESLQGAHQKISKELGTPTVLVNAAGGNDPKVTVTPERPFEQIQLEDWLENFDLNLVGGVLFPCQEFGAAMAAQGRGSIINIASVTAHIPLSRVVSYSAAKAALLNVTALQVLSCDCHRSAQERLSGRPHRRHWPRCGGNRCPGCRKRLYGPLCGAGEPWDCALHRQTRSRVT